ncbi:MAG: hypothetical protein SGBAC_012222 [Bacillariaceae sp.]
MAGCKTKDQSFLRRAYYEDEELYALVGAAATLLNVTPTDVMIAYGRYFIAIHLKAGSGYTELLKCQGSTLRQWLSNLNAMHEYIKRSFPGEGFIAPVFWCEDCEDCEDGSILLHYYSMRGTMLVPLVVGIVEELARSHFGLEVRMDQTSLQGDNGATFTTWRISSVDESQQWKLSPRNEVEEDVNFKNVPIPAKCPFSGRNLRKGSTVDDDAPTSHPGDQITYATKSSTVKCPFHHAPSKVPKEGESSSQPETAETSQRSPTPFNFELHHLTDLFPFHILVDDSFSIINVGEKLSIVLQKPEQEILGLHIGDIVEITRPVLLSSWDWKSLNKLSDQNFYLTPTIKTAVGERSVISWLKNKVSMADCAIRFQASMYRLSSNQVLFALVPDARNVTDLHKMGLTLSDLPLSSCQRDAVFLGEHVAQEASRAHNLDKLTKQLAERDLSKVLLSSMLPERVAEDLIQGKTVEPAFHKNVTLFFSDVVGFTSICNQVEPWNVIDMMNQLYSVMDFLASHFDLYKVETVGDAYMCASGLINPDEYHAEKMANFALAVLECAKQVKSPVDGSPIQLRIGIHTGSCTSGVVGTLAPHYCLFGDMVNTASRHESTGMAGKIQCSSVHFAKCDGRQYNFRARGLVDMKGKGEHYTYWLDSATEENAAVNEEGLKSLSSLVVKKLGTKSWKKRRYFGRGNERVPTTPNERVVLSSEALVQRQNAILFSESSLLLDESERIGRMKDDEPFGEGNVAYAVIDYETRKKSWENLDCNEISSQSKMESTIFEIMMHSLDSCIQKSEKRLQMTQELLRGFVSSIANTYMSKPEGLKLRNITETLLRCNSLWESRDLNETSPYALGTKPWDHFVLLFSAFIHQVKHTGSTNATLESKQHLIAQMYEGMSSCQQRRSVDFAFALLEDEFEELYDEFNFGCPNFRSLVRKTVLSTDLENENTVHKMLGKCKKLNSMVCEDERQARQRNEANIGLILAMATVGQYTQSLDKFLQYSGNEYDNVLKSSDYDASASWYYEQSMFMKDVLLPMIKELTSILPLAEYLEEGARQNIAVWDKSGQEWMAVRRLKQEKLHAVLESRPQMKKEMCCDTNKSNPRMLKRLSSCDHSLASTHDSDSTAASYLASQMVTEAESLSKVMARYERKYETVLGNLTALAYKGQPCPVDLQRQGLSKVHNHFKEQDWYRSHAQAYGDDVVDDASDELLVV